MLNDNLTLEYVCSTLDYDPGTGVLVWKNRLDMPKKWNTRFAGKVAGTKSVWGYIEIAICFQGKSKKHKAHRLAWLINYGEWPEGEIDHINGIRHDNRIDNLRSASHSQNAMNAKIRIDNSSGYKGVSFNKKSKKFYSYIYADGRYLYLGSYNLLDEAVYWRNYAADYYYGKYRRAA